LNTGETGAEKSNFSLLLMSSSVYSNCYERNKVLRRSLGIL
jgi:hypothetical protein